MQQSIDAERSESKRERQHEAMLEAALARPGVREMMKVYGDWQDKNRNLDAYRSATRATWRTMTTNSSNIG